jgi:hypothetical protein
MHRSGSPAIILIILAVAATAAPAFAAYTLTLGGNAVFTLNGTTLASGAGSNFLAAYETPYPGGPTLSVTGTGGAAWTVKVWLDVANRWYDGMVLRTRRVNDGRVGVAGGLTYMTPILSTQTTFFSGTGDQLAIPIQVELSGATCTIPVPLTPYVRNLAFRVR